MRKFNPSPLCLFIILMLLGMVFPLQATVAEVEYPGEHSFSMSNATQDDLLYKQMAKPAADPSSSDLPERFVLGKNGGLSPAANLELQDSSANESILEYTLVGSSDKASYKTTPLCRITPIQSNGSVTALVGNDPESGNFMWLSGYDGVFPRLSSTEALEVLSSHGYSVQNDYAKLVFFDYENYWMFNVTIDGNVTNAFVSFSSQETKVAADMLQRLIELEEDHSCIPKGGSSSTLGTSELAFSTSSYPSVYDWMYGKVPWLEQTGPTCGVNSLKQVFWWWGTTFNERYIENGDIQDYFGLGPSGSIGIDQMQQAAVHFMGNDNSANLDVGYGTSDKNTNKAWIQKDAPVICVIRAPGSGAGTDINHAVTLFGWDDSLGGGSWLLHDTASHFDIGYDVWVEYTYFDTVWNRYWIHNPDQTRGAFSVKPGDGKHPDPKVEIQGLPPGTSAHWLTDPTLTLTISLENQGTDAAIGRYGRGLRSECARAAQGVFIRVDGARFVSASRVHFDQCRGYNADGTERYIAGASIIEFYSDMPLGRPGFDVPIFGYFTIRPTSGPITVYYRGWIADEDDTVREDEVWIDDSRPNIYWIGYDAPLAEPRIVRYPADDWNVETDAPWNDRDNFLDYPVGSVSFAGLPENPVLTSPTHVKGQVSADQVLTVEWATPYAHGGVGGYSYTIVSQDDPLYDVNRAPDDTIDLDASATSFTTQPLETDHIWEFNIKTIDSEGVPARFYSSFWVEIASTSVSITRPRSGDVFEVGEWVNVYWEMVTWGGDDVSAGYDVDTIDLLKGPDFVTNLLSNWPNTGWAGFAVPDVDPGSDYKLRIVLGRNTQGDMFPYLPEMYVGISDFFTITTPPPIVVDVAASDPSGQFSVTINAGADKGAPVTSWTEISTTNIESYTVALTDGDMVMVIEGQLIDPNLEGQIVLEVDPVGEIIIYEINIAPFVVFVAPTIESSDSTGTMKDSFDLIETVYVVGRGYSPSATYDIYVVEDVATWTDGMAIPSRVPGTATSVSSDASGIIQPALVWSDPLVVGKYDIVVDVDGNGAYDEGMDALDDGDIEVTAGFLVIPEVPLGTIAASAAMIIALLAYVAKPKWRRKPTTPT